MKPPIVGSYDYENDIEVKKTSVSKIVICLIAMVLVIAAATAFILYEFVYSFENLSQQIVTQVNYHDFNGALKTVKKLKLLRGVKNDQIERILSTALSVNTDSYIQNSQFDEGIDSIEAFKSVFFEYDISFVDRFEELLSNLIQSERDFNEACELQENFQYSEAIEKYTIVSSNDIKNYNVAQQKIQECKEAIFNNYKDKASEAYSEKDYQGAIDFIDEALKIKSDDEAKALKAQYTQSLEEQIRKAEEAKIAEERRREEEKQRNASTANYANNPINNIRISNARIIEEAEYRSFECKYCIVGVVENIGNTTLRNVRFNVICTTVEGKDIYFDVLINELYPNQRTDWKSSSKVLRNPDGRHMTITDISAF